MFESSLMKFQPQRPVLADAINLDYMLPKVLALLNRIHAFIHSFSGTPRGAFQQPVTTNARFGG